ncbi:MAG: hypothetical protein KAS07_02980 [Candidatus Pacebacteria bacterium]|nr:hypothetical protein [Candidatus Paceibacterota bacterium]
MNKISLWLATLLVLLLPISVLAWDNDRMRTQLHPKILNFTVTETGYLADMEDNTQVIYTWIYPELLMGEWENALFFVYKGEFIYSDDLRAVSVILYKL